MIKLDINESFHMDNFPAENDQYLFCYSIDLFLPVLICGLETVLDNFNHNIMGS